MTAPPPRPTPLPLRVEGIPESLRVERRWVVWRYVLRDCHWTKMPFQASGIVAKANDKTTWTTFAKAWLAYTSGKFDGVGFVLGDGWAGIDLDKCVRDYDQKTGNLFATTEAVGPFVLALDGSNTYWEISPSGTGYKAVGRAARIGGEVRFSTEPPTKTPWTGARFFAITGHYQSCALEAVDISPLIDDWFPPAPTITSSSTREGYSLADESTDDDLLLAAVANEANGDQFLALWRGETDAYDGDHSRADLALIDHLAFWTNFDAARVDRLFRQSGLYRPKWEHASYRRATLAKAFR